MSGDNLDGVPMDSVRVTIGGLCLYAFAFGLLYLFFCWLGLTGFAAVLVAAFFTYGMVWVLVAVFLGAAAFIMALFSGLKAGGR